MSDEQQSGQAQTPDRHTLGNAITDYPNAPTKKLPKYLSDVGVKIAWGDYPKSLLTTHITLSINGVCHELIFKKIVLSQYLIVSTTF